MASRMTHYCELCSKRFSVDEKRVTLKELHDLRLMTMYGKLWHISCSKIKRTAHGSIDLAEDSRGQLVKVS